MDYCVAMSYHCYTEDRGVERDEAVDLEEF